MHAPNTRSLLTSTDGGQSFGKPSEAVVSLVICPQPLTAAQELERRLAQSSGDEALQHAIAAADLYMQAAQKATTAAERARLSRRCNDFLALGERLKANARAAAAASRRPVPESTRPLTTLEKTIVLKASRLHGNVFPPWESAPRASAFSDLGPEGNGYMCVKQSSGGVLTGGADLSSKRSISLLALHRTAGYIFRLATAW